MSPEEKRAEAIFQAAVEVSRFSGPLPHPEDLAKYEQVLPGAADRIIRMAEQQAAHRQSLEKAAILSSVTMQKWGLGSAFVLAMTAIGGGICLSLIGYERSRTDRDNFRTGSSGRRLCLRKIGAEKGA